MGRLQDHLLLVWSLLGLHLGVIRRERGGSRPRVRQVGGVPLGPLVQFGPPFLLPEGERGKEREEEKERGAPPPPLVQFGLLP